MNQNIKQKRMMKEIEHLNKNPSEDYTAAPLNNDLYNWHFTIRGPTETEFEDGIYHGKIIFPFNYPLEPPDIYFLNKSGRFEINQKICLTITGFHADQWNSSWTMRSILEALISMFPEKEQVQSVGSLVHSSEVRKKLAKESWNFECDKCGPIHKILKQRQKEQNEQQVNKTQAPSQDQKEQNSEEGVEIVNNIDIQKEKQNLDNLEQKIYQLQQEKPKISILQANIQQKSELVNKQTYNEVLEQERQYTFYSVAKNLQEIANVIQSIKIISNDTQSIKKEKSDQKVEQKNTEQQSTNQDSQNGDQQNPDNAKNQDQRNTSSANERSKENRLNEEEEEEQKEQSQTKNTKELNIQDQQQNDDHRLNDLGTTSQNLQDNSSNKQEDQSQREESKQDQSNQEKEDEQKTKIGDEQEEPFSEEIKQEAIQKIKKLDILLGLTSIIFILYLTFLFQTSI